MATTTDNLNLNLYEDNDPADLRDGYNESMGKLDTAIYENTTAISKKADVADMTAKLATKANTSDMTAALATKANTSDMTAALAKKASTSDVQTNAADIAKIRISNLVDIRLMGCKPDDESIDNAELISTFLKAHPKTGIYVPNGEWYIKSTLALEESEIYCDGSLCAAPDSIFDGVMVKLGKNLTAADSSSNVLSFLIGKHIKVKVDGKFQKINGISFQGFFGSTLELIAIGCMGVCVQQLERSVECRIFVMFYGQDDSHRADIGFFAQHQSNDNTYHVIGRNANVGIDIDATYLFFSYIHIWGCEVAVQINNWSRVCIGDFYPDYCWRAIQKNTTESQAEPTVSINNVMGIFPDDFEGKPCYFIGNDRNRIKIKIKNYMNEYKTFYHYDGNTIDYDVSRLYEPGVNSSIVVTESDMNTFTTLRDFIDKYGLISKGSLLPSVKVQIEPYTQTDVTLTDSQYYKNIATLGYKHADTVQYYIGKAYITIERIQGVDVPGNRHAVGGLMMCQNTIPMLLIDDGDNYRTINTTYIETK